MGERLIDRMKRELEEARRESGGPGGEADDADMPLAKSGTLEAERERMRTWMREHAARDFVVVVRVPHEDRTPDEPCYRLDRLTAVRRESGRVNTTKPWAWTKTAPDAFYLSGQSAGAPKGGTRLVLPTRENVERAVRWEEKYAPWARSKEGEGRGLHQDALEQAERLRPDESTPQRRELRTR